MLHEKPQASFLLEIDLIVCPESSYYYYYYSPEWPNNSDMSIRFSNRSTTQRVDSPKVLQLDGLPQSNLNHVVNSVTSASVPNVHLEPFSILQNKLIGYADVSTLLATNSQALELQ